MAWIRLEAVWDCWKGGGVWKVVEGVMRCSFEAALGAVKESGIDGGYAGV